MMIKDFFLDIDPYDSVSHIFKFDHFAITSFMVLFALFYGAMFINSLNRDRKIKQLAVAVLVLQILRYIWMGVFRFGGLNSGIIQFNLCDNLGLFLPIYILFFKKNKYCDSFICTFSLIAGLVVLIFPRDVLVRVDNYHFLPLQSMFSHVLFTLIPCLFLITNRYVPSRKDTFKVMAVFMCFAAVSKIMSYVYNDNFMFMQHIDLRISEIDNIPFAIYFPIAIVIISLLVYLLLYFEEIIKKGKKYELL